MKKIIAGVLICMACTVFATIGENYVPHYQSKIQFEVNTLGAFSPGKIFYSVYDKTNKKYIMQNKLLNQSKVFTVIANRWNRDRTLTYYNCYNHFNLVLRTDYIITFYGSGYKQNKFNMAAPFNIELTENVCGWLGGGSGILPLETKVSTVFNILNYHQAFKLDLDNQPTLFRDSPSSYNNQDGSTYNPFPKQSVTYHVGITFPNNLENYIKTDLPSQSVSMELEQTTIK